MGWLADADRLTIGFVLGAIASVYALSVAFFSQHEGRGEFLIYGRHNEGFMPLLGAAGTVLVVGAARKTVLIRTADRGGAGSRRRSAPSWLCATGTVSCRENNVITLSIPAVGLSSTGPRSSSMVPRWPSSSWRPWRP